MELILGGVYQGKLDYARNSYALTDEDIFICTEQAPLLFDKKCVAYLEAYVRGCIQRGEDAVAFFQANRAAWQNSVLLCTDIFCGVVPMGEKERAWREMTGRLCAYLNREAAAVTRLFCGLPQRLK